MFSFETLKVIASLRPENLGQRVPTIPEGEINKPAVFVLDLNKAPFLDIGQGAEDVYDKLFKSVIALTHSDIDDLFLSMNLGRNTSFSPDLWGLYSAETQMRKMTVGAICERLSQKLNAIADR